MKTTEQKAALFKNLTKEQNKIFCMHLQNVFIIWILLAN